MKAALDGTLDITETFCWIKNEPGFIFELIFYFLMLWPCITSIKTFITFKYQLLVTSQKNWGKALMHVAMKRTVY